MIVTALARFWSFGRLWQDYLSGPLYIPDEGRYVIEHLVVDGPARLVAELEHLSMLGSPWASAALAYIYLLPGKNGQRDVAKATELCRAHAARGDSYSQFVLAWALLYSGKRRAAIRAMQKAALRKFPPATLDFVTFIWNGWGVKERNPRVALRLLHRAIGHKASLIWLCALYRSGQFGALRKMFGRLLMPFARMRYALAVRIDPFSCRVFNFNTSASSPLFRTPIETLNLA